MNVKCKFPSGLHQWKVQYILHLQIDNLDFFLKRKQINSCLLFSYRTDPWQDCAVQVFASWWQCCISTKMEIIIIFYQKAKVKIIIALACNNMTFTASNSSQDQNYYCQTNKKMDILPSLFTRYISF